MRSNTTRKNLSECWGRMVAICNGWTTSWGHCHKRNIQMRRTVGDAKTVNKLWRLEPGRTNGEIIFVASDDVSSKMPNKFLKKAIGENW